MKGPDRAIVLCGGEGTRLRPITYSMPKSLVPVNGKPVVEHIFDLLKRYGVRHVIVSVGYLKEKIIAEQKNWSKYGMHFSFVEEEKPLGTAGPLRLAEAMLTKTFIASNGDELKDIDIGKMYEAHKRNRALVTIALAKVDDPGDYGVARLKEERIVEFVEKPKKGEAPSNMINAGLSIVEPEVINMIPENKFCMLERDIFPQLARQGKLFGFAFSGKFFDIGTPERYELAKKKWKTIKTRI
jgi:NDP-sugar pyrophosphorylase family protein